MSNDPVRLTFPDGTQLFTMGDSWSVRMDRLFDTAEEAQEMYNNDYEGYVNTTPEEISIAEKDEEQVLVETTYGSSDRSLERC